MVNIDISVLFQIVNFLLLIWLMNIVLYKPVRSILIQRKEKIEQLGTDIKKFELEALNKNKHYNEGINNAKKSGIEKKENLLLEAQEEEKKIIDEIVKANKIKLEDTKNKISLDIKKAKEELSNEIDVFAREICNKILGRSI